MSRSNDAGLPSDFKGLNVHVCTPSRIVHFKTLADAIEWSDARRIAGEPNAVWAEDVHGVLVKVSSCWTPDCSSESFDDTHGGIVQNQWQPRGVDAERRTESLGRAAQ